MIVLSEEKETFHSKPPSQVLLKMGLPRLPGPRLEHAAVAEYAVAQVAPDFDCFIALVATVLNCVQLH